MNIQLQAGEPYGAINVSVPTEMEKDTRSIIQHGIYRTDTTDLYDPACIVDAGACIGAYSLYAALKYPKAKIYAYEPIARNYTLLRGNTAMFPNIHAQAYALDNYVGHARMWHGLNNPGECSLYQGKEQSDTSERVEVRDIAEELSGMLKKHGKIGILKIDTEGNETILVTRVLNMLTQIDFVVFEFHHDDQRRSIDQLIGDTHLLYGGHVRCAHRGVLRYVRRMLWQTDSRAAAYDLAESAKSLSDPV